MHPPPSPRLSAFQSRPPLPNAVPPTALKHLKLQADSQRHSLPHLRSYRGRGGRNVTKKPGPPGDWPLQICNGQTRGLDGLFTEPQAYVLCIVWGSEESISRLRLRSWRFVRFEADHVSATSITHSSTPAPKLPRVVHTSALPAKLFASLSIVQLFV